MSCHTCDICTVCIMREASWQLRTSDWLNVLSHTWLLYSLYHAWSLVTVKNFRLTKWRVTHVTIVQFCIMREASWRLRTSDWLNILSHMWYLYSLYHAWSLVTVKNFRLTKCPVTRDICTVCIIREASWRLRTSDWLNVLSHVTFVQFVLYVKPRDG